MIFRGKADAVREQIEALELLEGYPKKPTHVGAALRHLVPETYSPGAMGWSDKLTTIPEPDASGDVEVKIPDAVVDRHEGKTVSVRGKDVVVRVRGAAAAAAPRGRTGP